MFQAIDTRKNRRIADRKTKKTRAINPTPQITSSALQRALYIARKVPIGRSFVRIKVDTSDIIRPGRLGKQNAGESGKRIVPGFSWRGFF
jgi:hypothetical protein